MSNQNGNTPAQPALDPYDNWLTVKQLALAEKAFTAPSIRANVHNAKDRKSSKGKIPGNGLAPFIRRVGSKVIIHHGGYRSWYTGGAK